jgi:hypothetical protein
MLPTVQELVVPAARDAFLRQGNPDRNEGANPRLLIQASGNNRVVVGFDLTDVDISAVTSARLVLTIVENGNNWGSAGRPFDAHPLLEDFSRCIV